METEIKSYLVEQKIEPTEPGANPGLRYVLRPGGPISPVTAAGEVMRWLQLPPSPDTVVIYESKY